MALTKSRAAISQLTATGQSTALNVAASYRHSIYVKMTNGTATITAGATVKVQARPTGSSQWYDLLTLAFGTTASVVETRVVILPDDTGEVRLDYTAPTGGSGHALDAEVGTITAF